MNHLPRRQRVRIHPYVEPAVAKLLAEYSAASGIPMGAVVGEALRKHLDRTGDMHLIMRRLDRLAEDLAEDAERAERDRGVLAETFAAFVQDWFARAPQSSEDAKQPARGPHARLVEFLRRVVERYATGPRFLDGLRREVLATETEQDDVAARGSPSRTGRKDSASSATRTSVGEPDE